MSSLKTGLSQLLREQLRNHPLTHRLVRTAQTLQRRLLRKPRTVTESPNLLPLLIQVLAAFSKTGRGDVLEEEIDSSLGFLRYDYPEAVYSELRKLFRQALNEQQDLNAMALKLANELSTERKIMLGVQLYDLISKAGLDQEQVVAYYGFMALLGMAAQAIDIVYQLNANEESDKSVYQHGQSPLESLTFGANHVSDVKLKGLSRGTPRRVPIPRPDPSQKPELQRHRRPGPPARAGGVLPDLLRPTHRAGRTGAHLPGPGLLF